MVHIRIFQDDHHSLKGCSSLFGWNHGCCHDWCTLKYRWRPWRRIRGSTMSLDMINFDIPNTRLHYFMVMLFLLTLFYMLVNFHMDPICLCHYYPFIVYIIHILLQSYHVQYTIQIISGVISKCVYIFQLHYLLIRHPFHIGIANSGSKPPGAPLVPPQSWV